MADRRDVKAKADALRKQLAAVDKLLGLDTERERDASRKRSQRQAVHLVLVAPCADKARRAALEADDIAWLMHYFALESGAQSPFTYEFTTQQREMINAIRKAILTGDDQAIAASRGEGKTLICERLALKYTLQGVLHFSVLFGATKELAGNSLQSIKAELELNDYLRADYPEVCDPVRALENTPNRAHYSKVSGKRHDTDEPYQAVSCRFSWCGQQITLPHVPGSPSSGAKIAARGLDSAVRGLKKLSHRLDLAIIDDPDTENTARSGEQADKLEERIDRGIAGLGHQTRRVARVMITTLQSRISVSYRFTDPRHKHSWHGKRFRFLVQPPERADLWTEYVQLRKQDWENETKGQPTQLAHDLYLAQRETMELGAVIANPNRYVAGELSALQHYYNQVARTSPEAVATEYDNDPPDDDTVERLVLTAYHIQTNCLSGLGKRVVPEGTICITVGGDVQKLGLHYVAIAWDEHAVGCILDYDFYEFTGTARRAAADCEVAILEGLFAWYEAQQEFPYLKADGECLYADLSLIDMGWKEESWNAQPVQGFCSQVGFGAFLPSKGFSPYRRPHDSRKIVIGDNWHVAFPGRIPLAELNADHWKLKVHEGFLAERGQPGSLTLFDPPRGDGRQNRTAHLSYSKHILAETWESRFVPGFKGTRTGWWKSPKPNHYLDATYQAIAARSMRGISVLGAPALPAVPVVPIVQAYDDPTQEAGGGRNRW